MNERIDALDHFRSLQSDLDRAVAQRMEPVRKAYVTGERDAQLGKAIDRLVLGLANLKPHKPGAQPQESRVLAVVGEAGAGKTTAMLRCLERHPAFPGHGTPEGCDYILSLEVQAPATLARLGRSILERLGNPHAYAYKGAEAVWTAVKLAIRSLGVRVLHFDEFHVVLTESNSIELNKIRATCWGLVNDRQYPVALILSGTPQLLDALKDPTSQLLRRKDVVTFPSLETQADVRKVNETVKFLAGKAKIAIDDNVERIEDRLMHACAMQLGRVIEMTTMAIEGCLYARSEVLRIEHFAAVYARATGNSDEHNTFLVKKWALTSCADLALGAFPGPSSTATSNAHMRKRKDFGDE